MAEQEPITTIEPRPEQNYALLDAFKEFYLAKISFIEASEDSEGNLVPILFKNPPSASANPFLTTQLISIVRASAKVHEAELKTFIEKIMPLYNQFIEIISRKTLFVMSEGLILPEYLLGHEVFSFKLSKILRNPPNSQTGYIARIIIGKEDFERMRLGEVLTLPPNKRIDIVIINEQFLSFCKVTLNPRAPSELILKSVLNSSPANIVYNDTQKRFPFSKSTLNQTFGRILRNLMIRNVRAQDPTASFSISHDLAFYPIVARFFIINHILQSQYRNRA